MPSTRTYIFIFCSLDLLCHIGHDLDQILLFAELLVESVTGNAGQGNKHELVAPLVAGILPSHPLQQPATTNTV